MTMKIVKNLFSVLLITFIIPFSIGNTAELDRQTILRNLPEIIAFDKLDKENSFPSKAVLFVGSSSINFWESAEAFPGIPIINRGFGGSVLSDILFFYDRVIEKYRPRTVVIYVGDNDIAQGFSVQETSDNLKLLFEDINKDFPDTKIIYLPIKPSLLRWHLWPEMKQVNKNIADYTVKNKQVFYVDTATPLLTEEGVPDKKYFVHDGLHLNEAGYAIWN